MSTADTKQQIIDLIQVLNAHKGMGTTALVAQLPSFMENYEAAFSSFEGSDIKAAVETNPGGLKRKSKSKLSDGSELRIFEHPDCDEEVLGVVEGKNGKVGVYVERDIETLRSVLFARNPVDFVFGIVREPGEPMEICIIPKWCADDMCRDKPKDGLDSSVSELEPMWKTSWWESFQSQHLSSCMESIWNPKDETLTMDQVKAVCESIGMVYDVDVEKMELEAKDLEPSDGWSGQVGGASKLKI